MHVESKDTCWSYNVHENRGVIDVHGSFLDRVEMCHELIIYMTNSFSGARERHKTAGGAGAGEFLVCKPEVPEAG